MLPFVSLLVVAGLTMQAGQIPAPPAQAPASAVADSYSLFVQGRALESRGDLPGAVAAYTKALAVAPRAADIHAELAALYARDGRAQPAINEAELALAIDPKNHEAHRIAGLIYAALAEQTPLAQPNTNEKLALSHLEEAYAGGVRDPIVLLTLGRLWVQASQYAKGIEILSNFLLAEPGYPEGIMLLAEAYDDSGQVAQAIGQLETLPADRPELVRAQTWLAELYERAGRWSDAAAKWGSLALQAPRTVTYRVRRAGALLNLGGPADLAASRDILTDVVKNTPKDAASLYLLAHCERRLGNAAGAEDAARRIIALDPNDPRGPLAMAEAKTAAKDYKGAVATLEPLYASVSQTPGPNGTRAFVARALAESLRAAGDGTRAIKVLEDTSRENPDDLDLVVSVAAEYEHAGQYDQAERTLRGVLVAHPDQGAALNALGYMFANRNQKLDEAAALITRALVVEAENPAFLDSLGWVYVKQRKYAEAASPLERAAAALPRDSVVLDHLGELYFQQKRYREAADAWTRSLDGDRVTIDAAAVTKKRDRARELAK
jgi:tetratricopeptide (TPR) repeat protein